MEEPKRRKLPDRRNSVTHKLHVGGQTVYLTIGLFEDGTPGEIFIVLARAGSSMRCALDQWARMFSTALQWGCPLSRLCDMHLHVHCEPCGNVSGHPDLVRTRSIFDLVARLLGLTYLSRTELANQGAAQVETPVLPAHPGIPAVLGLPLTGEEPPPEEMERRADEYREWAGKRKSTSSTNEGTICSTCDSTDMIRTGSCLTCRTCGSTSGC